MASFVTTKLLLAILMGSLTTAACGLLAVAAVNEQSGAAPATIIAAESPLAEADVSVNAPRGPSAAQANTVATVNSAGAASTAAQAWPAAMNSRVQLSLRLILSDIAYNAMPLQQVMEGIADDFNVGIRVDEGGLETVGIGLDAPVTLNVPPMPLSQALDYILSPLELSYRVEGDVLFISSRRKLDARPNLRVYDCSIFETPGITSVIEQSMRKIQPKGWDTNQWSITMLDEHLLFVAASDPVHAEIEMLLSDLARQLGKSLSQPAVAQKTATQPKKKSPPTSPSANPFSDSDNPFGASADPFGQ